MGECSLLNLGTCLPEMFVNYILSIINAPLQPFIDLTKTLLTEPIRIDLFVSIWAIIVYVLSMFYAFLIIYSGFQFIVSGYDSAKRERAKEWLKNIIVMIVLVQASFFIYSLAIDLGSVVTSTTLSLMDQNFFRLTLDNVTNIGLELMFSVLYAITLIITLLLLVLRYAIVSVGVVLFPLGIFSYFIEPLKPYGSLIMNFLGVGIFITFLDAIILIGFSQLVNIPLFANFKILVMISGFTAINFAMFFLMFFSIIKSALNVGTKAAAIAAKFA